MFQHIKDNEIFVYNDMSQKTYLEEQYGEPATAYLKSLSKHGCTVGKAHMYFTEWCEKQDRLERQKKKLQEKVDVQPKKYLTSIYEFGTNCTEPISFTLSNQPSSIDNEEIRARINQKFQCPVHRVEIVDGHCSVCGAQYCKKCSTMIYSGKCECKNEKRR